MTFIYKMLYRLSPRKYENVILDEYIKDIPQDTLKPTVQILDDYHKKLTQLQNFLAYQLHRRMSNDPKNSDRYEGMLIQMKIYMMMIESAQREKSPDEKQQKKHEQDSNWYNKAVEGVNKFVGGDKSGKVDS